ncbi:MAG TPA: SDR family oxidoreductase [Pseudonocardiaceae bacterium]
MPQALSSFRQHPPSLPQVHNVIVHRSAFGELSDIGTASLITVNPWAVVLSLRRTLVSLTLNLMAAVRATRAALPLMLAAGNGAIVNVVSVNAFLPDPAVMDYSAAKAALANFSKSLSKEVGPQGIRVNTVSPGPVATDLWLGTDGVAATAARASGVPPEEVADSAVRSTATGRFTQPNEVADLVLLLVSQRAKNVTGTNITIDGGLTTTL